MTDVILTNTPDGGEISLVAGTMVMDGGLATAAFLSLWGGNIDDSGLPVDKSKEWWANKIEPVASRKLRSKTQNVLSSLSATPANLIRVEDAVNSDLEWMVKDLSATIEIEATMPGRNRVAIAIEISIDGKKTPFLFDAYWGPSR